MEFNYGINFEEDEGFDRIERIPANIIDNISRTLSELWSVSGFARIAYYSDTPMLKLLYLEQTGKL